MSVPFIEEHLRALRLPTMLQNYKRLAQGDDNRITYLGELSSLEVNKRHENGVRSRIAAAKFPVIKNRSSGIRVGEQADYPALPSTSRVLKPNLALAQRAYKLAQESRPYWVSLSTVSSSRAVGGVSQDESRLPPPTQPARLPPGYPHKLLKTH